MKPGGTSPQQNNQPLAAAPGRLNDDDTNSRNKQTTPFLTPKNLTPIMNHITLFEDTSIERKENPT